MIGIGISRAADLLRAGEVVVISTEMVYGLVANVLDFVAVLKIFEAKQCPVFDLLIVHVHERKQLTQLVREMLLGAEAFMDAFWPGLLIFVLSKTDQVSDLVTSGLDIVGVWMLAHFVIIELLRVVPFPLAAPSANPFGYVSPTTAQHVADQLGDRIPYILDGGACEVGVESTILGWV